MARLEFEFVSIGANGIDNDINKINNNFKGLHGTIEQNIQDNLKLANQLKEVRQQLKETGNSNVALSQTQRELQQRYNDSNAVIRQQINAFDKTDGSLAQMRSSLSLANRAFDNLNKTAREGNIGQNLSKQIATLTQEISKAEQATGRFQRNVGNYQQAQSGANGVAMEFNRIIQDAPYGMMGIGNNIQQLAANWQSYTEQAKAAATANGTTVTSMGLMKGAISSILSPANLLTLGIAAVTSAWAFYTMQQQKANKATKDNKSEMDKLKESLSSFQKVQLNGVNNYAQEIAKLQTLYKVATNTSESTKARTNALRQLQEMYPKVFSNLDLDTIKTDKVSSKYKELSSSIIAAARAQAAFAKMSELSGDDFTLISKAIDNQKIYYDALAKKNALQKEWNKLQKENPSAGTANYYIQAIDRQNEIMKSAVKTAKEINRDRINIGKEQERYSTYSGAQQEDIVDLTGKEKVVKNIKEQFDYLAKIRDLLGDKQEKVAVLDLKGEQKELKELEFSYVDFFNKLTDLQNKLSKDKSVKNKSEIQEQINNARELGEKLKESQKELIESKWIEERTKLIDEIYGKLEGVAQTPLEKKFADWAKEVEKFKNAIIDTGNPLAQFQSTLDELTEKGNFLISAEEGAKNLKEWQDNNDKIAESINKPFGSSSQKKLQQEMQNRLRILEQELIKQQDLAQKYFTDYKASDLTSFLTEIKGKWQLEIDAIVNAEQAKKDIQDYVSIANNGLNSVFTNLKTNIDEFGLKARSVFYTLGESLGDLIKQLANKNTAKFMEQLTKDAKSWADIKTNFNDMWKNNKGQVIGAGLGMAGSAVLSMSSPSDSIGQGLGGALSGAGAGAVIGSQIMPGIGTAYGAAIGAVVGGVSGLLKAAKNRRQEKILLEQYEEQKKANRLLERMSALTYASQIIGQKTEYGIVSGVRRNEFGQIVSVVQGQDIIMVADRTNKQKGR